jgi:PD-(D/E)XK nuclease superfamily
MTSIDFPLVLSMSQFAHYRRCRKMFEYDAIHDYNPKRDTEAMSLGRDLHELLAYAALHDNTLPQAWGGDQTMFDVAREYLRYAPIPIHQVFAVERGFYAEIAPAVFIRGTFDRGDDDGDWITLHDYKSFERAPTLDPQHDNQAKEYTVIAKDALGRPKVKFVWDFIRRELGRLLKGKGKNDTAVFTPWPDSDRYYSQEIILDPIEEATIRQELFECAQDIRATIENNRFYRTYLKAGPHSCDSCLFKDICNAELAQGFLDDQTLELLTAPPDWIERVDPLSIRSDPRVLWYMKQRKLSLDAAVDAVYGRAGVVKMLEGKPA